MGSKKAKPFKPNPSRLYYPCARVSLCSSWFGRFGVEPPIHAERSIWVLNEAPATVTVTQRGCTQLNSTQLNSTQLNSTQLNSTPSLPWPLKTCDTQIYCSLGPSKCGIGKAKCCLLSVPYKVAEIVLFEAAMCRCLMVHFVQRQHFFQCDWHRAVRAWMMSLSL